MANDQFNLPHLLVPWTARPLTPKPPNRGGNRQALVDRSADRQGHSSRLAAELTAAQAAAIALSRSLPKELRTQGFAVRVEAAPSHELNLDSLDRSGLSLLCVRPSTDVQPQDAVVWIGGAAAERTLQRKIDQFPQNNSKGKPKNEALVANIERIAQATIGSLWREDVPLPDMGNLAWWELWFDLELEAGDQVETLQQVAGIRGWDVLPRTVGIGHYRVAQVNTTLRELTLLLRTNAYPSEIRRPTFTEDLHCRDMRELHRDFVLELAGRLVPAAPGAPVITLLDTGIDQEHALLRGSIAGAHSAIAHEGPDDNDGHGTQMGGLALFGGELDRLLQSNARVALEHRLESVKILPRNKKDQRRSCGEVSAVAIATAETSSLNESFARVFTMAVTYESDNGTNGGATLWSASLDALAAGTDVDVADDSLDLIGPPASEDSRLIIVSAGNVREHPVFDLLENDGTINHLNLCDLSRIEDPAQAWNVLTVGAFTELDEVPTDVLFSGYRPVAASGELSPYSRTSVLFPGPAPIKPDIVMEGGNLLIDADNKQVAGADTVYLTTTNRTGNGRDLTTMNATSAATAQAARLAALVHARYPELRPETIRALLVHEAEWTPEMVKGILTKTGRRKGSVGAGAFARNVLRRYGWGVPVEDNVLTSRSNAVTLIVQGELTPFQRQGDSVILGNLNLHELPWPREQLLDLDAADVRLRVTLSYFVEPNPGPRGMLVQHTYPSYRLKFALKGSNETLADFERRISESVLAEENAGVQRSSFDVDSGWLVGRKNRERGSLHADIWRGTARELADCGTVAVYPAGGWWKYHNSSDRVGLPVFYGLLLPLRTPEITTDLYTPLTVQLAVPIPASATVESNVGVPVEISAR